MKSLPLVLNYLALSTRRRNVRTLGVLLVVFFSTVVAFATVFHELMAREDQYHSWPTAFYWTLVTMTTLGFGDITFQSDAGRIFSVVVLLTGTIFLLVLLPFAFIQFVFVPWMAHRDASRAPRRLPETMNGHLLLTNIGPMEEALIRRAERAGVEYAVLVADLPEALALHDRGFRVIVGDLDSPASYLAARVTDAALVVATRTDVSNANIAFTVREIDPTVPLVATVSKAASVDILRLAGATEVLQLGVLLGRAMAERGIAPDGKSHVIGSYAGLHIAEARVASTSLVGQTLAEAQIRSRLGVGVIGTWQEGRFEIAGPDTVLIPSSVLILAGSEDQLEAFNRAYATGLGQADSVLILGGGRVGRAAAKVFAANGADYRIVEQEADRAQDRHYIVGDAAELEVLEEAGIRDAAAVLITTHDDDINIYLTIYCQRLRPDIQVVARANLERNVSTLYRAGADDVLSYASTGAAAVWNHLRGNDTLVVAEGLSVFRSPVPYGIVGRTLADSGLRQATGCNVVALDRGGRIEGNPGGGAVLDAGIDLILIGDDEDQLRFAETYPPRLRSRLGRRRR